MKTIKNPILPGFHPDPSICRVDDDYFLVNSSFEYFPGVPIYHSKDLVNWNQIGYCLTRKSQLNLDKVPSSGGIYAPTIRYHNGIFYMITTNVNHDGTFYVKTNNPFDEWSDPIKVNIQGYDPSFFFDDDGKIYLTYSNGYGILQSEINIETGELINTPILIWNGTGGQAPEGPHLYKINGYYYLLIAEGGTEYGHMVTIARSNSPWGPFESCPQNPILTHRSLEHPIRCVGHADLIQAQNGTWWIVCLGTRPIGYPPKSNLGRETFLVPVKWDNDGWPIVGNNGTIDLEIPIPNIQEYEWEKNDYKDDFEKDKLNLYWNFRRNPEGDMYSLTEKKGYLILKCTKTNLDDIDSLSFIGRRQQDFNCEVRTKLEFNPIFDNEEAGLTIYLSEKFHYDIAVFKIQGQKCILFRKEAASLKNESYITIDENKPLILGIKANQLYYSFYFEINGKKYDVGKGEVSLLTTEVGGKFTGNYFGLYATGNGQNTLTPAYFDWFEYIPYKEYVEYTKLDTLLKDPNAKDILLKYFPDVNLLYQMKQYNIDTLKMLMTVIQYRNMDIDGDELFSELSSLKIN